MKKQICLVAGVVFLAMTVESFAESEGKVYGKIYADWYYDFSDNDALTKKSEFEISRVYLGYKYTINERFTADALFDVERVNPLTGINTTADSNGNLTGINVSKDQRYMAFLKTAYLSWKDVLPRTTLSLGQIPFFAFNVQEKFWGHRYVYKSFMDKQGWEPSADMGVSVAVAPVKMLEIVAGVVNGQGYKAPQDAYGNYKTAFALRLNPLKGLALNLYGDWMPQGSTADNAQTTVVAFAGYGIVDLFKTGFEYNSQMQQKGVRDHNVNGVSLYGMWSIINQLEIFARFDMAFSRDDWNTEKDGKTIIAGLQYSPVSKVKFAADYQRFMPESSEKQVTDMFYLNCEFDY